MQSGERAVSVNIRIQESEMQDAIRMHVMQALDASFQRFSGKVRTVRVTLQDVNGPRGGVDKSCRIEAKLFPSRRWVMQEVRDADVFAAITLAIQRVRYSVRKALERARVWRARRETIRKRPDSAEEEEDAGREIRSATLGERPGEAR